MNDRQTRRAVSFFHLKDNGNNLVSGFFDVCNVFFSLACFGSVLLEFHFLDRTGLHQIIPNKGPTLL